MIYKLSFLSSPIQLKGVKFQGWPTKSFGRRRTRSLPNGLRPIKHLMIQRLSRGVTIGGSFDARKEKKEKRNATAASARKPNKGNGVASDHVREEVALVHPTPKKPRISSPEVYVIEKPSKVRPQNLTVPADTSLFKELKMALEVLKRIILEKDQKHLFENQLEFIEELALAGHKVLF